VSTLPTLKPHAHKIAHAARRHHARGFWVITYMFAVTMASGGIPAPLYVLYQQRDGLNSLTLTLIFAAYALGVVISLFLAGHISDRFGRRRIIGPAVLLTILSTLLFIVWPALPGLLVARFISGLGIGMLTATATAHMTELLGVARPGRGSQRAQIVSTAANMGGIGLGPLISGILAQYAPQPLYTPYMVTAFLLVLGLLAVMTVPETVAPIDEPWQYKPQRVVVPRSARGRYIAALMMGFVSFAMFGFFTSLAPSVMSLQLHITSHILAGLVPFLVFAAAAAFQILSSMWQAKAQNVVGVLLLALGVVLVPIAIVATSFALLIVGGIVAGAGGGITFKAALGSVVSIAPAETRGEALAGLFLAAYLGLAVPVILLGLMMQLVAMVLAVTVFGLVMVALLIVMTVMLGRASRAKALS
jgi:MFS family permease